MKFPTNKTLFLLISCCVEESRFEILEKVVMQLLSQVDGYGDYGLPIVAFDNGSTHPGTVDFLKGMLSVPTYAARTNLGYWSAIRWALDNVDTSGYEYIHIIESDHYYYDLPSIALAENFLDEHPEVGAVRLQEYSVAQQHLYNKSRQHKDGKKYAWVTHTNTATGKPVELHETEHDRIYTSNFLTVLHGLNRLDTMREVFDELGFDERFSEPDFQRLYHQRHPIIALLDGGIFHAKLGFTPMNPKALSGSWSHDVSRLGYRTTRQDTILRYGDGEIADAYALGETKNQDGSDTG